MLPKETDLRYTAVIRTLGTAGDKYLSLLESLYNQEYAPEEIIAYIPHGFTVPIHPQYKVKYCYVNKGMVAQRALNYDEVHTEYILFLDDDLSFPSDFVKNMFYHLYEKEAAVISPDIFPNDKRPLIDEISMFISGRMKARRKDNKYGYKVLYTSGYSYNKNIKQPVYISNTNAGACFLCKKKDFLKINFRDELWLDNMAYAMGEDQVMFYKMYLNGLKQITFFNSGILHLDGGNTYNSREKRRKVVLNDLYFRRIFFHRFLLLPENRKLIKFAKILSKYYFFTFSMMVSLLKLDFKMFKDKLKYISLADDFLKSEEYLNLPPAI